MAKGFFFEWDPMQPTQSVQLLIGVENSDPQAAQDVFDRYTDRLVGLAYKNLSLRMQRRVDAEDIVQSAYRSFFRHAEAGRFTIHQSGDLWRLLAAITIAKVKGQVEFHSAQKRSFASEVDTDPTRTCVIHPEAVESEPTAEDAVSLAEELQFVLQGLDATSQHIIELAMQNYDVRDIAQQIARSQRTVRRTIQHFREQLEHRLLNQA